MHKANPWSQEYKVQMPLTRKSLKATHGSRFNVLNMVEFGMTVQQASEAANINSNQQPRSKPSAGADRLESEDGIFQPVRKTYGSIRRFDYEEYP